MSEENWPGPALNFGTRRSERRGVYTAKRKNGTAVYIDYTVPGTRRVREKVDFVPNGPDMKKRLRESQERARKECSRRFYSTRQDSWLTPAEAGKILGKHRRTIIRWCNQGKIKHHRYPLRGDSQPRYHVFRSSVDELRRGMERL